MNRRFVSLSVLPLIALAALLAFPAGTLAAQPTAIHESWDFTDTATDFCGVPGLTVGGHFTGQIDGHMKLINGQPFPYFSVQTKFFDTWTGPNGKVVTVSANRREQDATIVNNGDGTITLTQQITGAEITITGPDGTRVIDRGLIRVAVTVDDNGTPSNPDDDIFLSFDGVVKTAGPHPDWDPGGAFCPVAVPAFTS
jgi:hypothetical protein